MNNPDNFQIIMIGGGLCLVIAVAFMIAVLGLV